MSTSKKYIMTALLQIHIQIIVCLCAILTYFYNSTNFLRYRQLAICTNFYNHYYIFYLTQTPHKDCLTALYQICLIFSVIVHKTHLKYASIPAVALCTLLKISVEHIGHDLCAVCVKLYNLCRMIDYSKYTV